MPVRACPDCRKVITATDEQNGMRGHDGEKKKTNEGEKNAGRSPHTTEVEHNTQKGTQTKTKHTQRAHVASWIQVCYMPCYATQRTRDKNGNHANKSKR